MPEARDPVVSVRYGYARGARTGPPGTEKGRSGHGAAPWHACGASEFKHFAIR